MRDKSLHDTFKTQYDALTFMSEEEFRNAVARKMKQQSDASQSSSVSSSSTPHSLDASRSSLAPHTSTPGAWFSHKTARIAAAAALILVVGTATLYATGAYAQILSYFRHFSNNAHHRYQKTLSQYENELDASLTFDGQDFRVDSMVLSNHSIIFRIHREQTDESQETPLFSGLGINGSWQDGSHFTYESPAGAFETQNKGEYILVYGMNDDILADAASSSVSDPEGRSLSFRFTDSRDDNLSCSDSINTSIEHTYTEKDVYVNRTLSADKTASVCVEKISYNGMFWCVYYNITSSSGSLDFIDDSYNGTHYALTGLNDQKEFVSYGIEFLSHGADSPAETSMLAVDAPEDLADITLRFRKYSVKNTGTSQRPEISSTDEGYSDETLDIDLTEE